MLKQDLYKLTSLTLNLTEKERKDKTEVALLVQSHPSQVMVRTKYTNYPHVVLFLLYITINRKRGQF